MWFYFLQFIKHANNFGRYSRAQTSVHCTPNSWRSQNYKWQNGKECKGKMNWAKSALARRLPYIEWLKNSIVKISRNTNFWRNYFEFRKVLWFEENFVKHKIKHFAKLRKRKFLQPTYSYTIWLLYRPAPPAPPHLYSTLLPYSPPSPSGAPTDHPRRDRDRV